MTARPSRRRGILQRPVLLFGLLLLGPAVGFCLLGWDSVVREHEFRVREMERTAREVADAEVRTAATDLDALRDREGRRSYFEYQAQYYPQEAASQGLFFQSSALNRPPEDPRVLGWFQWEAGPRGAFPEPEVLGPAADALRPGLVEGYREALRSRLDAASGSVDLRAAKEVTYPLRVVQANEERGQLLEELEVRNRQQSPPAQQRAEPNRAPAQAAAVPDTPYLVNFAGRASDEPVAVKVTRFQYLARPATAAGPPLLAWRLVWIPSAFPEKREVTRDRWLLQGYLLDPGRAWPGPWRPLGQTLVGRLDAAEGAATRPDVVRASLADAVRAERLSPSDPEDASLVLAARPDLDAADAAWSAARSRFLFLVAGLVSVVAVGFTVLMRGVRREVALARRKEDFVAAVTHELKTPLTGIRMYADMLREGWVSTPAAAEGYADRIIEECGRLGNLVDQVLDLAALERGVATLRAVRGDLGAAVKASVALMESKAAEAGTTLEVDVADGLPPVLFDEKLVRPLVLNLVDNAVKYSARSETKHVKVSLVEDGAHLALRVSDQGVGIAPEVRRRLFEPFQRAGDELTRSAPGVGIGLALVRRYADAHRAKVVLESEPGRGTTVTVRFPV
jgi:signal transduction histidine kinase